MPGSRPRIKSVSEGLFAFLNEWLRTAIHTATPGIIETFDPTSRRAEIRFALEAVLRDETCIEKSPMLDVPILMPVGAGGGMYISLAKGDPVWVMFSERGIQRFKESYTRSEPYPRRLFDESDAVAIPGFGAATGYTPKTETGICMQDQTGDTCIKIENGEVTITVGSGKHIYIGDEGGRTLLTSDFLRKFNQHTHTVGGQTTTGPSQQLTNSDFTDTTRAA